MISSFLENFEKVNDNTPVSSDDKQFHLFMTR